MKRLMIFRLEFFKCGTSNQAFWIWFGLESIFFLDFDPIMDMTHFLWRFSIVRDYMPNASSSIIVNFVTVLVSFGSDLIPLYKWFYMQIIRFFGWQRFIENSNKLTQYDFLICLKFLERSFFLFFLRSVL